MNNRRWMELPLSPDEVQIQGEIMTRKNAMKLAAWAAVWAGSEGTAQERWDAVMAMYKRRLTDRDVTAIMLGEATS